MKSARSTPPPALKRLTRDEAKASILEWSSRDVPLLVGPASVRLGVGWSLQATEALFTELVSEERIRPMTKSELLRSGLREGYLLV